MISVHQLARRRSLGETALLLVPAGVQGSVAPSAAADGPEGEEGDADQTTAELVSTGTQRYQKVCRRQKSLSASWRLDPVARRKACLNAGRPPRRRGWRQALADRASAPRRARRPRPPRRPSQRSLPRPGTLFQLGEGYRPPAHEGQGHPRPFLQSPGLTSDHGHPLLEPARQRPPAGPPDQDVRDLVAQEVIQRGVGVGGQPGGQGTTSPRSARAEPDTRTAPGLRRESLGRRDHPDRRARAASPAKRTACRASPDRSRATVRPWAPGPAALRRSALGPRDHPPAHRRPRGTGGAEGCADHHDGILAAGRQEELQGDSDG